VKYGRLEEDTLFILGTRFTRGGGTNGKRAAGSGRFRVSEPVWTPGKYPKDYTQDSKYGESLKSRVYVLFYCIISIHKGIH
jgi:hypothetical protein